MEKQGACHIFIMVKTWKSKHPGIKISTLARFPTTEYKAALNSIYVGSLIGKYSCKKLKNKNYTLNYVYDAFIV